MIAEYMMIVFFSIILIFIKKRSINNIDDIKIRWLAFFFAGFFVQFIASYLADNFSESLYGQFIADIFIWIHCLSYQLILIGLIMNIEKTYMRIFLLGTVLNFTVIIFNGMKMPVNVPDNLNNAWENYSYLAYGKDIIHTVMTNSTKLKFLGDIINLDHPYPWPKSISIGDVVLLVGLGWFFHEESYIKK